MKGLTKWFLIAVSLIFCIQAVSAFAVSSIIIDPQGSLTEGTQVLITYKVDFTATGDETFPSGDELQMSTDLEKAKWSYSLVLDGVDTPQPSTSGRVLTVSGWVLSYPSSMEEALKVTVEGTTPAVSQTGNKTLLKVCEYDSHNNVISCVERTTTIVNPKDVQAKIAEKEAALQSFRSHIDEKSALGIDTAAAEAKYSEAEQKIKTAKSLTSTQYVLIFSNLDAAQAVVEDGEIALDRAWAENEVNNAQIPINNVDKVIEWFRANDTRNDAQLPAIMTKREIAVSYLVTAQDEISNGNFDQARVKAQDAFNKGNESYTDALARKKVLESGFQFPGLPDLSKILKINVFIIVAIVVVVVAVVGYVIYRKRSHWDELG
jgi:hypothetical protein